ncbi:AraC family transcriptional regulator [Flectobacillus rivi]|uniref:AraC family transcriptional regulator n=1 Tax=Flectobacillus rivi TaxID=2984209 RepID=A0ABT6Z0W5_9BACT|nr:AraC family transcriptional regulator [Flectobacillus rivi]MDI9874241.1 AraC family transcriptional regulator [Flectobacillus rivi]
MLKKSEGFIGQRSFVLPDYLIVSNQQHPLSKGLYITDIGYYPRASFHNRERASGCEQYILIYCVDGEGWYSVNDVRTAIKPHQFFVIPAQTPHQYGADVSNPWSIYWIHFTGQNAKEYLQYLFPNQSVWVQDIPENKERNALFNDILAHIEMSYHQEHVVYANLALGQYLNSFKITHFTTVATSAEQDDPISNVIHYMKEHLSEIKTLEDFAQIAGMSASHFSAVFRQKLQSTPVHFFTFLKMQRACYLLEFTTLRVKEVAFQMGYHDPYHFSRVFTNIMGKSPRDFRNDKVQGVDYL